MATDLEIAREAKLEPIENIARTAGFLPETVSPYGRYVAKIDQRAYADLPQRDQGFDAIAERIYRFDEVKSVYLMSGAYDLLLLVEAHTLKELAFFVSTKLSTLETVTGTATHFVLKRYKSDGVIFEGNDGDKRLVVTA